MSFERVKKVKEFAIYSTSITYIGQKIANVFKKTVVIISVFKSLNYNKKIIKPQSYMLTMIRLCIPPKIQKKELQLLKKVRKPSLKKLLKPVSFLKNIKFQNFLLYNLEQNTEISMFICSISILFKY